VADSTVLFDDLIRTSNLRSKTYVVQENKESGLACVELSARRADDWFFARRWVTIRQGRRFLYWILDELETAGFRFQVHQVPNLISVQTPASPQPWALASTNWASLSAEERRIHVDLFPQEELLLRAGYDWDDCAVYKEGRPLPRDQYGRLVEETDGVLYEWARIMDEYTWRRYPLYVLPMSTRAAVVPSAPAAESSA
jgi:hypothetical protein